MLFKFCTQIDNVLAMWVESCNDLCICDDKAYSVS